MNSVIGRQTQRSSSLSAMHTESKKFNKQERLNKRESQEMKKSKGDETLPSSKEEKMRNIKNVYGVSDDKRILNRQNSRGSIRSSHSVQTP